MKFSDNLPGLIHLTGLSQHSKAQTRYTHHFAKELDRCEATFVSPVEGWYKIKMLRDQREPQMDLALQSEDKALRNAI